MNSLQGNSELYRTRQDSFKETILSKRLFIFLSPVAKQFNRKAES